MAASLESQQPLALAVTDIDHFKRFNDTYGHKAGDFVLAETASLLRAMVRPGTEDACFRYGGEEFCMLMPGTSLDEAGALLEEYRRKVESSEFEYEGQRLTVTVSVGVAGCPESATAHRELFESADQALYAAKQAGRNRVAVSAGGDPTFVTG